MMEWLRSSLVFLIMLSGGYGLSCRDNKSTFYSTDASTNCTVYHLCHNSKVTTFRCPFGQAFDTKFLTCRDALFFSCTTCAVSVTGDQILFTNQAVSPKYSSYWKLLNEKLSKEKIFSVGQHKSTNMSPFSDKSTYSYISKSRAKRSAEVDWTELFLVYRLMNRIIFPLLFEIKQNQESKTDIWVILLKARLAYSSIASKISSQADQGPNNFHVSKADADLAKDTFFSESKSTVRRVVDKNIFQILKKLSENVPLVLETIDRLKTTHFRQAEALNVTFTRIIKKHADTIMSTRFNIDASTEATIRMECQPIENIIVEILSEFLSHSPSSMIKTIYDNKSVLDRIVMGEERVHWWTPPGYFVFYGASRKLIYNGGFSFTIKNLE